MRGADDSCDATQIGNSFVSGTGFGAGAAIGSGIVNASE